MSQAHETKSARPVGRLAPSPTGRLHLGHARSFLLAWWHSRSRAGSVLLRIEDLDRERVKPGMREGVLEDLEWLGLDWDGAPLLQSDDTSAMQRAIDDLLARELAYPCVCSRQEIALVSAPHAGEDEPRYAGTCRGRWRTLDDAERATGRKPSVRVVAPNAPIEIADRLLGLASFDLATTIGDFPIRRRDGAFAYQLAVVVDDARTGVNEIVRGLDLWPSAARQAHLQDLLGLARPTWNHVPLVVDEHGERMAKRRGDLSLAELRATGVDPRAVVAWVARSSGHPVEPRIHPVELLADFDLERVPREPARISAEELQSLRTARR